jgi:hypothetical protein
MSRNENPARAPTRDRAHQIQEQRDTRTTTRGDAPDFATVYVATRYRLPLSIAAVIARLAELGGALS